MKQTYTMKQSHTFRRTLSALILLLASTLAWAYDFETGGIYYNIIDETSVEITSRSGSNIYDGPSSDYAGNVIIPATVSYDGNTYNVTSIGDYAFFLCSLTSIDIPANVTSIGNSAFAACRSLSSIELPEGLTSIGNYAFDECYSLTSINIPAGVTSIGNSVFRSCI